MAAPARRFDLAALGVAWLALALRLYHLVFQSLWRDEVDTLLFATRPLATVLGNFRRPGENGPLYFLLMRPWLAVTGHSEFALRFPSALAGALAVPLIYVLVRRLSGPRAGLIAALLAATAPYLVWYGQEARMYALLTVLVPLALWLTLRVVEHGRWWRWALLYVATSLSIYVHVLAALVAPVQVVWFGILLFRKNAIYRADTHAARAATADENVGPVGNRPHTAIFRAVVHAAGGATASENVGPVANRPYTPILRAVWLPPALYLAALILPYLPLAWWQATLWLSPTFQTGHPFVPLPEMLTVLAAAFSRGILPVEEPATLLPAMLALLAGVVLWPGSGRDWRRAVLLLVWLLLPPLVLFGVSLGMPLFADRYLIWIMPAFLALLALGVVALARAWRPLGLLTAGAILAFNLAGVWGQATQPIKADFRSAAAFVVERQQTGDLLIFQIPYIRFNFRYYSDPFDPTIGRLRGIEGPYTNDALSEAALDAIMAEGAAPAAAVWLVASETPMWDSRGLTQAWLAAHGAVTDHADFARVSVTRYQLEK